VIFSICSSYFEFSSTLSWLTNRIQSVKNLLQYSSVFGGPIFTWSNSINEDLLSRYRVYVSWVRSVLALLIGHQKYPAVDRKI